MIYFDNAATSYPKPFSVHLKAAQGALQYSFNSGRGGYRQSLRASEAIYDVREKAAKFFNADSSRVVFTKNCTEALNIAIKSACQKGGHVLISALEHNSVSRVVHALTAQGRIRYDVFAYYYDTERLLREIERKTTPNTKVLICTHASNLSGVVFPIREIGAYCRVHGITFVVDAAQSAGILDIDIQRDCIDVLCTAGHKGLMGEMGTGLLIASEAVSLKPLLQGGTGSRSYDLLQPRDMPEGFEAGTLNNSGILSLGAGIDFILHCGREEIYRHELKLAETMYTLLQELPEVLLYTKPPAYGANVGTLMFNYKNYTSEQTASLLSVYGICTRGGFHCAPLAHRFYATQTRGAVRVSFGAFNTEKQCRQFIAALAQI